MEANAFASGHVFGGIAPDGLKVAGGVGLLFFALLLFAMAALGGLLESPQTAPSAAALAEIPPEQMAVMQRVGASTGVPWQVLAAIAKVESGFGANMGPNSAGAVGYCQFMPGTWAGYGVDGNGDGVAAPADFRDCLPAAAALLVGNGAPADLRQALYAYNHSWAYVMWGAFHYMSAAGRPHQMERGKSATSTRLLASLSCSSPA